ncbi:MAG: right-handed parallel beta-helix repeat-containing protein, partial [Pseudomonadota bacterium]
FSAGNSYFNGNFGRRGGEFVSTAYQAAHVAKQNSPLKDSADPTICGSSEVGSQDQRGFDHDSQLECDIGSLDARESIITVNSARGGETAVSECRLSDALAIVNRQSYQKSTYYGGEFGNLLDETSCEAPAAISTIVFDLAAISESTAGQPVAPPRVAGNSTLIGGEAGFRDVDFRVVNIQGPGSRLLTVDGYGQSGNLDTYSSDITLSGLTITGNSTSSGGGIDISNSYLAMEDVVVSGNIARRQGGGLDLSGSTAVISNSTISDNEFGSQGAIGGGGIHASRGSYIQMLGSTVSGNSNPNGPNSRDGGGIHLRDSSFLTALNSTISGNSAASGAGLFIDDYSYASLLHTTIVNNSASEEGGGISLDDGGTVILDASIISGNQSSYGGTEIAILDDSLPIPLENARGENMVIGGSQANVFFSIIGDSAKTFDESIKYSTDPGSVKITGGIVNTSTFADTNPNPDAVAAEDFFRPLRFNGGLTKTHALQDNSIAVDAISGGEAACQRIPALLTDQRGERRDLMCDIGAYEVTDFCFVSRAENGRVFSVCL